MKNRFLSLVAFAALCMANTGHADFSVDLRTTTSAVSDSATSRLFLTQPSVLATNGVRLWFVLDVNGDGIPANPQPGSILGADDVLVVEDIVGRPNGIAGRYQSTIVITNEAFRGLTNAYVYIWNYSGPTNGLPNRSGTPAFVPQTGQQFGVSKLSCVPPPAIGNGKWRVFENVFADSRVLGAGNIPLRPVLSNFVSLATSSNVALRFSFQAATNATYRVQSTTNLAATPIVWQNETPQFVGGGSVTNLWFTNGIPAIPAKFFRIEAN